MGVIITKFSKKKTTYEMLEKLEKDINSIEEFRRSTEQTQKKMVGRFIFISVCVYCITAVVLYFYFFPATLSERLIYTVPLIIAPILLFFLKRILSWYYNRKIRNNQKKITNLKSEKNKILEEVMDKETYKVAKSILDKFNPEQAKKRTSLLINEVTPVRPGPVALSSAIQSQPGLRYRGQMNRLALEPSTGSNMRHSTPFAAATLTVPTTIGRHITPLPLPRSILPRERSVLDKMVDYLVGDGPSNRYALICKNCSSHNGMALKEEFNYLSFKCCYCMTFNPARKQRPAAPKLDTSVSRKLALTIDSDSDSNSEAAGPIITEPDEGQDNNEENVAVVSDCDGLSDVEIKNSGTELAPMEVDEIVGRNEEQNDSKCNEEIGKKSISEDTKIEED